MQEFESIVKTAYYAIIGVLTAIIIGRYYYFRRTRDRRIALRNDSWLYKFSGYATILALPFFLFGLIAFVFVLQKGNMFAPEWMKNSFLLLMMIIYLTESFYRLIPLPTRINSKLQISFLIIIGLLGFYLIRLYISALVYPAVEDSVVVSLPFEGKWIATGAGATGLTNHHDRINSQKYAIDIARIGRNGKLFTGSGIEKEESNTYGADIISPVDGVVAHLVDTLPDHPVKNRDQLAGNHIIIRFRDSLYIALAHLQPKSIPVKIGDSVVKGQIIGKAGMSGNTDFCHLHIHIQDGPLYDINSSKTYPIRFDNFRRKRFGFWCRLSDSFLLSNDIVQK